MNESGIAKIALKLGNKYPYDAPDSWWVRECRTPYPAVDTAHEAARGILHDLQDRRGIKSGFDNIDEETRKNIVESIAEIIRQAYKPKVRQSNE